MENILIVEDSKLFAGLISRKLCTEFPYRCVVKSTRQDAVTMLEEESDQYVLAILDLNLPDAPNGEIVPYVTSKNIPAIVMTSHVNDDIHDKILTLKIFDYILKGPQSLELLCNCVHRYFRNIDFQILLVDDSNFARELTRDFLITQYFKVIEAKNGMEALKCLEKNPSIKLLITDYHMPEMDGIELIKKVRENNSMQDLAIIGVSARGNPLLASQFLKCGANDFISKPYFEEELFWRVNQNVELLNYMAEKRVYQKKLEQDVLEQTAKIKESHSIMLHQEKMAAIGQLSAGIAHEINNPVGFISSNLGTLKNYTAKLMEYIDSSSRGMNTEELVQLRKKLKIDYIVSDIGDLITESMEGTERVKSIVGNLKNFSRQGETEAKLADINDGLESTLKIIWNELKYKAKVVKEYNELPLVKCYIQQLNQVFMNFLINAVHAIEKEGVITIKTWHDDNNIFVSVSDSGQGIPPENISKLFEPFFTTKDIGKGTGLGLSISYEIIKKHNGEIRVESEVGQGSTFTLSIPVAGVD